MRLISCFACGLLLYLTPAAIHAETISNSFSFFFDGFSGTSENSFGVPKFDPSLGTLTSVTEALTGNIVLMGSGSYRFSTENGIVQSSSTSGPFSLQTELTGAALSSYFATPGFPGYRIDFLDVSTTGTASFSSMGKVINTYTYNYTPTTVVTPEPSSLLLLATGTLALFTRMRRRARRS